MASVSPALPGGLSLNASTGVISGTPTAVQAAASYTTPATVAGDNGAQFTVVVGNAGGSVTSNAATLTVNAVQPPQIPAAEPANKTAVAGSTATFTVTATGAAPLAYQWYKGGTALGGATQASYTTPVLQLSDDGSTYYVVVTNAAGGANSRQAVLTVTQPVLGALTWKRDIVYLGTKEVAEISAAGVTVTLTDHLGSPRFVVEPSGNVVEQKFLPFGESLLAQADQARVAKGFTNHEQTDASGLIYMQARFYGPMYHRFLSPDPKYDEHFQNTQGWNIYVYCENSPVMRIDPDGMDWVDKVLGGAYNVLKCVPVTGSVMKITEAVTNQTASWGGETHSIGSGGSRLLHAGDGVGSLIVDVATLGQGGIAKNGIVAAAKEVGKSTGKRVAGKVAQEAEAKALGKLQKTFQTYTKTNAKTGEVYTGRTSGTGTPLENVASRDSSHHMNDKGFGPAVLDRSSSNPSAIRGREQILIDANGGARSQGGASGNAINGVSPSNPRRDEYLREGGKL